MRHMMMNAIAVASVLSFLGAGVASADFAIAGEWFQNRGPTVNIPPGSFDAGCPPNTTAPQIPFVTAPVPASQGFPAPCLRHQIPGNTAASPPVPNQAFAFLPQFGIPAAVQAITAATGSSVVATGAAVRIPASIFSLNGFSQVPVPANPVVQQLDTTFVFRGPSPLRTPSPNSAGQQLPGISTATRVFQTQAWSKPGQTARPANAFVNLATDAVLGTTRRVTYTGGANGFSGTMGLLLKGVGNVYVVVDAVTPIPGAELLISPLGNAVNPYNTVHNGRGYDTTQVRVGAPLRIYQNYNIPTPCTATFPPAPLGCGLLTGISGFLGSGVAGTTMNTGFPWTTGHVSAYAHGSLAGIPQTSTITGIGGDSVSNGVRTIQLVAAGVALRNNPQTGLGRTPHVDTVTIQLPEPGSTMALVGALGLIGGLYGVRRKLF